MSTGPKPELAPFAKKLIVIVCVVPLALSFVLTEMQWFPATYIIAWLADENGMFSFNYAVVLNWALLVLLLLPLLAIAAILYRFLKNHPTQ